MNAAKPRCECGGYWIPKSIGGIILCVTRNGRREYDVKCSRCERTAVATRRYPFPAIPIEEQIRIRKAKEEPIASAKRRAEKGERVAVYLPPELAHRLRIRCVREKRSLSDAFTEAAKAFLLTPETLPGIVCPEDCKHLWKWHEGESAPHECAFYDGVSSTSVRLRFQRGTRKPLRCAACIRDKGVHVEHEIGL